MRSKRRFSTSTIVSNSNKIAKIHSNDEFYVLTGSSKRDQNAKHFTCLLNLSSGNNNNNNSISSSVFVYTADNEFIILDGTDFTLLHRENVERICEIYSCLDYLIVTTCDGKIQIFQCGWKENNQEIFEEEPQENISVSSDFTCELTKEISDFENQESYNLTITTIDYYFLVLDLATKKISVFEYAGKFCFNFSTLGLFDEKRHKDKDYQKLLSNLIFKCSPNNHKYVAVAFDKKVHIFHGFKYNKKCVQNHHSKVLALEFNTFLNDSRGRKKARIDLSLPSSYSSGLYNAAAAANHSGSLNPHNNNANLASNLLNSSSFHINFTETYFTLDNKKCIRFFKEVPEENWFALVLVLDLHSLNIQNSQFNLPCWLEKNSISINMTIRAPVLPNNSSLSGTLQAKRKQMMTKNFSVTSVSADRHHREADQSSSKLLVFTISDLSNFTLKSPNQNLNYNSSLKLPSIRLVSVKDIGGSNLDLVEKAYYYDLNLGNFSSDHEKNINNDLEKITSVEENPTTKNSNSISNSLKSASKSSISNRNQTPLPIFDNNLHDISKHDFDLIKKGYLLQYKSGHIQFCHLICEQSKVSYKKLENYNQNRNKNHSQNNDGDASTFLKPLTLEYVEELSGHSSTVNKLTLSPFSNLLATSSKTEILINSLENRDFYVLNRIKHTSVIDIKLGKIRQIVRSVSQFDPNGSLNLSNTSNLQSFNYDLKDTLFVLCNLGHVLEFYQNIVNSKNVTPVKKINLSCQCDEILDVQYSFCLVEVYLRCSEKENVGQILNLSVDFLADTFEQKIVKNEKFNSLQLWKSSPNLVVPYNFFAIDYNNNNQIIIFDKTMEIISNIDDFGCSQITNSAVIEARDDKIFIVGEQSVYFYEAIDTKKFERSEVFDFSGSISRSGVQNVEMDHSIMTSSTMTTSGFGTSLSKNSRVTLSLDLYNNQIYLQYGFNLVLLFSICKQDQVCSELVLIKTINHLPKFKFLEINRKELILSNSKNIFRHSLDLDLTKEYLLRAEIFEENQMTIEEKFQIENDDYGKNSVQNEISKNNSKTIDNTDKTSEDSLDLSFSDDDESKGNSKQKAADDLGNQDHKDHSFESQVYLKNPLEFQNFIWAFLAADASLGLYWFWVF